MIYHFELSDEAARERAQQEILDQSKTSNTRQFNYSSSDAPEYGVAAAVAANMAEAAVDAPIDAEGPAPGVIPRPSKVTSTATGGKAAPAGYDPDGNPMSRNQPCWCGSGKKFKNCHGK